MERVTLKVAHKQLDDFFRVHHSGYYRLTDAELQHERMTYPQSQRAAICRAIQALRRITQEAADASK